MKYILITGGFGFIGSHLTEKLLEEKDNHVHVIDSLITSPIDVDQYLAQLSNAERLTYDICTIREFFARSEVPKFDEIYHLASVVGPVGVLKYGGIILRDMVGDAYDLITYCSTYKAKLTDVSTSEVYGGGKNGYCCETDSMIVRAKLSVRLEYAVSKLACEIALVNTCRTSDLHATLVRPFNVAGPRQSTAGGFVLPRFINQALAGDPLTVYGEGKSVRAFTDVRDIVDGIVRTMNSGQSGEVYNMGNPLNKTSIIDLAYKVVAITKSKSEITFVNPKTLWGPLFEEASDKYPDADRSIKELSWHPQAGLDAIIRDSIDYIRSGRKD